MFYRSIISLTRKPLLSSCFLKKSFSTVNKKQMQQFNKIKSWWHPSSEMGVLFQYNYERIKFLRQVLKTQRTLSDNDQQTNLLKPIQGMKVIDVGCGAGFLVQSLARLGGNVVGLDPNQTSYQEATSHKANKPSLSNLTYHNCSIQQYLAQHPSEASCIDLITSMDVIQHVDNPQEFISSLVSSLKPNGLIMLSTISKTLYSFLTHIVVAQYVTGLVPRGTHNFDKFLTPQTLCSMLEKEGVEILGLRQLEYNWRGEFEQRKGGVNYMVIGRKKHTENDVISEQTRAGEKTIL